MRFNGGLATAIIILAGVFIFFDVDGGVVHFNENALLWLRLNGIFLISSAVMALVSGGLADFLAEEWQGAFYSHFIVPVLVFGGSVYALMCLFYGPAGPPDIIVWILLVLLAYWVVRTIFALTNDEWRS